MYKVADALNRLVNKATSGLKALIDKKLDKNGTVANANYATNAGTATSANYATSAGSANTATNANYATSAGSATNDSAGNNISNTYAKKSEIPSADTSNCVHLTGNETISGEKTFTSRVHIGSTGGIYENGAGHLQLISDGNINLNGAATCIAVGSSTYEFKSDGIYLGGKKITN